MSAGVLRGIDPAQNVARFYQMDVQPELFGGWSFIREWGRNGRPGTVRALPCPTEAEALAAWSGSNGSNVNADTSRLDK